MKENENIKMLKKEFEYLCQEELEEGWNGEGGKGVDIRRCRIYK